MIYLYSLQHVDAINKAKDVGYLTGNEQFVDEFFIEPYKWLMNELNYKEYPVWFWDDIDYVLEDFDNLSDEDKLKYVIIKVEYNQHNFKCFDYNSWHCVLNNSGISLDDVEDEYYNVYNKNLIQETWKRVFDFKLLEESDYWKGYIIKQYVIEKISYNEIQFL